ncbi:MAG: hypothetical protein LBU77_04470 [Clostridiales bacterium]|nr:hypothetical protein [Clostridiales bacterium]
MKKSSIIIVVFVTLIALLASSLSIYAAPDKKAEEKLYKKSDLLSMTVKGNNGKKEDITVLPLIGLDESNEIEISSDKKSFSGNAENGTKISATVYAPSGKNEWKEVNTYSKKVGASGFFSISLDFSLGDNIVVIQATKGKDFSKRSFEVTRKADKSKDADEIKRRD